MKTIDGPLIMIAAAIIWCGSALMLPLNDDVAWSGIFAAALLLALGLRISAADRKRRD